MHRKNNPSQDSKWRSVSPSVTNTDTVCELASGPYYDWVELKPGWDVYISYGGKSYQDAIDYCNKASRKYDIRLVEIRTEEEQVQLEQLMSDIGLGHPGTYHPKIWLGAEYRSGT